MGDNEVITLNENMDEFYKTALKEDKIWLYIDLIDYYCQNSVIQYENFAHFYMTNTLKLIDSKDTKLIDKVISCIASIIKRLPKES